jgi:pyroglutamyl-peptidase
MKKLLITGFEPFGGETVNPSWEAVDRLPAEIGGYTLTKLRLPVVFGEAANAVLRAAEEVDCDVILCIGQAGGRQAITPELVGINLRHASIPDNKGNRPKDQPILPQGDVAYFSTLPVRQMADAISNEGIPSQVSYSAGAYVCNDLLYTLLAHFQGSGTRVGFIHIPYSTEQGKEPSMDLDQMIRGLTVAIRNMD